VHFEVQNHKLLIDNCFYSFFYISERENTQNFGFWHTFSSDFGNDLVRILVKKQIIAIFSLLYEESLSH